MKFLKKIVSVICLLTACIALISSVGCNTLSDNERNCGGIVDNVIVEDLGKLYPDEAYTGIEVTITINENSDKEDFYYTALFIYDNMMDKYNCKTLDEIVKNQNYIDDLANYQAPQSCVESGTSSFTFTKIDHGCLYILIYESSGDFNDTLIPVTDPSAYIGWIKF